MIDKKASIVFDPCKAFMDALIRRQRTAEDDLSLDLLNLIMEITHGIDGSGVVRGVISTYIPDGGITVSELDRRLTYDVDTTMKDISKAAGVAKSFQRTMLESPEYIRGSGYISLMHTFVAAEHPEAVSMFAIRLNDMMKQLDRVSLTYILGFDIKDRSVKRDTLSMLRFFDELSTVLEECQEAINLPGLRLLEDDKVEATEE